MMFLPALQGAGPNSTLLVVGLITLAVLVVLGKRFFVGLFEVVTAPGASIGYHGKENTFFFTMMVVLLGGLIGVVILSFQQEAISQGFTQYANETGQAIAVGNSNSIYRETAGKWGAGQINTALQTYAVGNFIWLPMLLVGIWIVNGLLFWLLAKMFGSQVSVSNLLGSLCFAYFFAGIALALTLPTLVKQGSNALFAQPATIQADLPLIIGAVLLLYAFILFAMGVIQGAELSGGQFIVCFLLATIVLGGASWYVTTYQMKPKAEAFTAQITGFDPSQKGWAGAGSAATPRPTTSGSSTGSAPIKPKPSSSDSGGDSGGGD